MNVQVSGEALRGEEMKSSHFLSLHLASVSFCMQLACDFSRFPINGELSCRLLRFSLLREMVASTL